MASRAIGAVIGGLIGAIPGVIVLAVDALFVEGEATLSVGVLGIFLVLLGVPVGAVLGSSSKGMRGKVVIGAAVGAIPGLILYQVDAFQGRIGVSLLILIGGAATGGLLGNSFSRRSPPHGL